MNKYTINFAPKWDIYFKNFDSQIQKRIAKKINQLKNDISARHNKFGLSYFVLEVGQYRICYIENKNKKNRIIAFTGTHKQYTK